MTISTSKVKFARVSLKPNGKASTEFVYFNHETEMVQAVRTIFQDPSFVLPQAKLIIVLYGRLDTSSEKFFDFNEKQFSTSVARLILDIGRNKLRDDQGAPWLFTSIRRDSVAERIIQISKQQYSANDIPLIRFVDIGIETCPSIPMNEAPDDYQSIANVLCNRSIKDEINDERRNSARVLNKRLSRVILYGRQAGTLVDRCSVLQRCLNEISRQRVTSGEEYLNVPKVILLYGGSSNDIEPIHRLMNADLEQRKFGLLIVRGSGGLADLLAWVCDKIRSSNMCIYESHRRSLRSAFLRELKVLNHQLLASDVYEDLVTLTIFLALTRCRRVRVYDLDDDLSLSLLETLGTVNQDQRFSSLKIHLSLAFDLNQPKYASQILRTNPDLPEEDLIQLVKMAIVRDQVEFLPVLFDVFNITSDNVGQNFDVELSIALNYNHDLFLQHVQEHLGCPLDDVFRSIDQYHDHMDDESQLIHVKLFLWSIFFDHYALSLHLWRRLNDRLCGALVAALIYRRTADLCFRKSSTESVTIQQLKDHADAYENLAVRLLQSLYISNPTMTRLALKRENNEFNKLSAIEVAIMSKSENFVGHRGVQEVFDVIWSGEIGCKIKGKPFDRMLSTTNSSPTDSTSVTKLVNDRLGLWQWLSGKKNLLYRPRIKYQLHFLFYLIFLNLLSFLVLFIKTYAKQSPSILEKIVHLWIFMFAFEEFRQIKLFKTKQVTVGQAIKLYFNESWNRLDVFCILLYVISMIFESFETQLTSDAARAFLAVDVVLWFARLFVLLMIDRTIGPMLLMIQAMLNDMVTFFSIFFVFTSAYGVASFALLRSGSLSIDLTIFRRIFHQAYWHVFGQINDLDSVKDNFELTGWTAFALLAFYMAISNILLVNLLVAMFSHTFDRMYAKMDTLWKFHRYHTIKEYTILSTLPPPLNLFSSTMHKFQPFHPELSTEQVLILRRREALAYESDMFEQATKEKQMETIAQTKLDCHLRQLRKTTAHIKLTCEASTADF